MAHELNDIYFNNCPITFETNTNNTAQSDELSASPLYQDKMGTNYSKSKGVVKAINFAGISLLLTAAAIKTGSLISNAYILNPPSVKEASYTVNNLSFKASFVISNIEKYKINCYLFINDNKEAVLKEDCSESKEYNFTYNNLNNGDTGHFYIQFSNGVDYIKTIDSYKFIVEG